MLSLKETFDKIMEADVDLIDDCWDFISVEAKDLIFNLLKADPDERLSATQALGHKWFNVSGIVYLEIYRI